VTGGVGPGGLSGGVGAAALETIKLWIAAILCFASAVFVQTRLF